MVPGTFMVVAERTGKTTNVIKKESIAFRRNGITPLEKNGATIIIAFILIRTRRNA